MLTPHASTARELSRATRTNLTALYGAVDRLETRGLLVRERRGTTMTFRVAHPSVVLDELMGQWTRARELIEQVQSPLRELYEARDGPRTSAMGSPVAATDSPAAASSWLLDRLRSVRSEIWFMGSEDPWFLRSPLLEAELSSRRSKTGAVQVRMLVRPPNGDEDRNRRHARLRRAGFDIRYSTRFLANSVIIDRRWMFVRTGSSRSGNDGAYVRLDAAELCSDTLASAEREWNRAAPIVA